MKTTSWRLAVGCLMLVLGGSRARAEYHTIDLSPVANGNLQNIDSGFPSSSATLGGVPFTFQTSTAGNNIWHADYATGRNPLTVDISVGVYGVDRVMTLLNTFWGQAGTSYASIEFFGSDGADYTVDLLGNVDIRDYNNDGWTNSINGTSTVNVVSVNGGQHRLDMQTFVLPTAFRTQTLTTIRLSDNGGYDFQRIFIAGVTVQTVPEPSTLALCGLSILTLSAGCSLRCRRGGMAREIGSFEAGTEG